MKLDTPAANSRVDSDTITISGSVLSGSENGEVYIETAFELAVFDESFVKQYNEMILGTWNKTTTGLADGEAFDLTMSMDGKYTNESRVITIYIKIYEGVGDNQRWISYEQREINLPACQGVEADSAAEDAGGRWILDADGECQWEGTWTYVDGVWTAPSTDSSDSGSSGSMDVTTIGLIAIVIIAILVVTMLIMRKGSSDSTDDTSKDFHAAAGGFAAAQLDPVENMYNNWSHKDIQRKLHVNMRSNMLNRLPLLHLPLLHLPLLLNLQWIKQFTSNIYNNSWLKDMMRQQLRNMLSNMPCNMRNSKVELCNGYSLYIERKQGIIRCLYSISMGYGDSTWTRRSSIQLLIFPWQKPVH